MKLHLGVVDIPYANMPEYGATAATGTQTTGDVATWLENKYHIMESFYELHDAEIADFIANSAKGAMESVMMGVGTPEEIKFDEKASEDIYDLFNKFIDSREIEGLGIPGVPTTAAKEGVNHRLKSKRGPRRPSFRDTGLYEDAFKAWID